MPIFLGSIHTHNLKRLLWGWHLLSFDQAMMVALSYLSYTLDNYNQQDMCRYFQRYRTNQPNRVRSHL
jgi:hypothetical protein